MNPSSTPSWLKIDDDKFKDLLEYLCKHALTHDSDPFFAAAKELLRNRVKALIPVLADDMNVDEESLVFRTRLMGAWLLCFPEQCEDRNLIFFGMVSSLAQIVSEEQSQGLFGLGLRVICCGLDECGFAWDDLMEVQKERLAKKILAGTKVLPDSDRDLWFDGKGILHVAGEEISVMPVNRKVFSIEGSRFDESLRIVDGKMCLYLPKADKLKQSESSDITLIKKFTAEFRRTQKSVTPSVSEKKLRTLNAGDEVMVRVIGNNASKVTLETADPTVERVEGTFYHDRGLFYYQDSDFAQALKVGEYLKVVVVNTAKGRFSIYDAMQDTLLSLVRVDDSFPCEYIKDTKSGALWFTNEGVPVYTADAGGFAIGDHAYVRINFVGGNGYITGQLDDDQDGIEDVVFDDSKQWLIREYFVEKDYVPPVVKQPITLSQDVVRIIERALFNYQKTLSRASEIYKVLSYCQILSELTCDDKELDFLELKAGYLEQLVLFTKGQYAVMKPIVPAASIAEIPSVDRSVRIVNVLREIESENESSLLTDTIRECGDPLVVKIARIIQSYNRIKDIVPEKMLQELKMEITRCLSLEGEVTTSLDDDDDENLGMEDKVKEFKTSFVFPADKDQHMQPNLKMQSRSVYRAICAFLNSMVGGTLYLGVSDHGYVVGLENDLAQLRCNMDAYIRLIQDEAKKAFDKSILDFLDFSVMFDGRVLAIKVRPFDDGVVCLDGVPYKRNFAESVAMREDERLRLISTKVVNDLGSRSKIDQIECAIREKKRVVLKRYASSTRTEDRKVEPFKLFNGSRSIWAYDIEAKANKQFRVSRIAAVDVLQDGWSYESSHKAEETDIFNWSGKKSCHIEWEMSRVARNILLDDYPMAEKHLSRLDPEGNSWSLVTDVFDLAAPVRFYIGLADHITILAGDEFRRAVKDYVWKLSDGVGE